MRAVALAAAVSALVAVGGALLTYALIARPAAGRSSAELARAEARIADLERQLARCIPDPRAAAGRP